MPLSPLDYAAVAFFLAGWFGYHLLVERSPLGRRALNNRMNEYRLRWMLEMQARENRIVDSSIMATLQSGTSFFASTSLLALGGSLTLLRGADDALRILSDFPLATATARTLWDVKVIGLVVIFGYAFFKFAWSYRLFNYASILIGATPSHKSGRADQRKLTAVRAAEMNIVAGKHFNRGQRAFFFALAYLGWFVAPGALIVTTAVVVVAILMRQFGSDALAAASLALPPGEEGQGAGNRSEILPDSL